MGRKSSIRKLDPELRKELDRLLMDDRLTQAQIVEHMRSLGASVSESAVYRYNLKFQDLTRDMRIAREMAVAVGRELDAMPEGADLGRVVVESFQSLLLQARMQFVSGEKLDDRVLGRLAAAAKDLNSAWKMSVDSEIRIKERAAKKAAVALGEAGRKRGLTAETVDFLRAAIGAAVIGPQFNAQSGAPELPAAEDDAKDSEATR